MYTPLDIQQKTFRSGMGYKKTDVDTFMAALLESYEHLYKENIDLNDKVRILTQSLAQYKTMEKSLQKALILAQEAAEDVRETANASARLIEEEARVKAREIINQARRDAEDIQAKTLELASQLQVYKSQCIQAAKAQLEVLESDLYKIDINKVSVNIPDDSFIEEKREQVHLSKIELDVSEKTDKIIKAAEQTSDFNKDEEINQEFFDLVAEVIDETTEN